MRIREFLTEQLEIKAALEAMQLLGFVSPERVRPISSAFSPQISTSPVSDMQISLGFQAS